MENSNPHNRLEEIERIGQHHNRPASEIAAAVRSGISASAYRDRIRNEILDRFTYQFAGVSADHPGTRFSLLRSLEIASKGSTPTDGAEGEYQAELVKKYGPPKHGPNSVYLDLRERVPYLVARDMTVGTSSAGGYLVGTDNLGSEFIDVLRNSTVALNAGVRVLDGLQGSVTFPRMTASGTAYWLANEGSQITESQPTLGQMALTPKNLAAYTEISHQLALQSNPSAEAIVWRDLAKVLGVAIDAAIFEGSGTSGQPTGIANTAGIGSVVGTSLDAAKVAEFQTDVAAANALAPGCVYVTTPAVASLLMQRVKVASTWSPLWEGSVLEGTMMGRRALSTNNVTAGTMVFGDFSQVVLGMWGPIELAVNPYSQFTYGIIGVRAWATCDVGVRIGAAFSRATSIT
jgi:HK97 family phage major capsid protein